MISVNIEKAREITREKLRIERTAKLERLDVEFLRALETGADTTSIIAEKQLLRDITKAPAIESAATPEELKRVLESIICFAKTEGTGV